MTSTTSSNVSIGACFEFPSTPAHPGDPPDEFAFGLSDDCHTDDGPTPAEIEHLTQLIIAAILRGRPETGRGPPQI